MLLDHLGAKHGDDKFTQAGRFFAEKTDTLLISDATRTSDLGGSCTTSGFGEALVASILDS
jgi:hypothetical protein